MTDVNVTAMGDVLSPLKPTTDGFGARMAEQVSIEADRLVGTMKDGVEAAQKASKNYSDLLTDIYIKIVQGTMQNSVDFSNHALALLQAKTPFDAFELNHAFVQKEIPLMQRTFLELMGMDIYEAYSGEKPDKQS